MELSGAGELNRDDYTRPELCILLSQMALERLEQDYSAEFNSRIEMLRSSLLTMDLLPENLFRLGQLTLGKLDVATALLRVSEADIENLVSVGQTMSMKLSFIALPNDLLWPATTPKIGETFEECLPRPDSQWLSIIFETALAIRLPLYHHGVLRVNDQEYLPFQRLIYPLAPAHERNVNHRVLSICCLDNDPTRHAI